MNKVQNQLEEMGVFESKKLAQKMLEVEERMHEKAEIRKGYWWVSLVSFVAGVLFFINDGVSLVAFMGLLVVGMWLQERTDKKLKKLDYVTDCEYVWLEFVNRKYHAGMRWFSDKKLEELQEYYR